MGYQLEKTINESEGRFVKALKVFNTTNISCLVHINKLLFCSAFLVLEIISCILQTIHFQLKKKNLLVVPVDLSENVTVSVTKQEPRGVNLVVKIKIENSNYVGKG